jgi:serine/threonine-protein kinase RIO1
VMDILSLESKSLAHPCFMLNNKTIVYKFYMEDLVHSDLQTVNILCREDSVIVIVLD